MFATELSTSSMKPWAISHDDAEGLAVLTAIPAGNPEDWTGPIMQKVPRDPWGRKYQYVCPGTQNPNSYDLWSSGPDGKDGGGDDIANWEEAGQGS